MTEAKRTGRPVRRDGEKEEKKVGSVIQNGGLKHMVQIGMLILIGMVVFAFTSYYAQKRRQVEIKSMIEQHDSLITRTVNGWIEESRLRTAIGDTTTIPDTIPLAAQQQITLDSLTDAVDSIKLKVEVDDSSR